MRNITERPNIPYEPLPAFQCYRQTPFFRFGNRKSETAVDNRTNRPLVFPFGVRIRSCDMAARRCGCGFKGPEGLQNKTPKPNIRKERVIDIWRWDPHVVLGPGMLHAFVQVAL